MNLLWLLVGGLVGKAGGEPPPQCDDALSPRTGSTFLLGARAICSSAAAGARSWAHGCELAQYARLPGALRGLNFTRHVEVVDSTGCSWEDFDAVRPRAVVLVRRGRCAFSQKARHAMRAGAAALLVEDRQEGAPMPPALSDDSGIDIAVAMVSAADGLALRRAAALPQSPLVVRVAVVGDTVSVPCMASVLSDPQEAAALQTQCTLPSSAALGPAHRAAPGARFLGYNFHYGRTNNHLFSLANALAFARLLNRTLVYRDDPYLACHNISGAAREGGAAIVSLAEFKRLSAGEPLEVVQYAFEAAVTARKYTHFGLPRLGFCDERVVRTELLPAATLESEATAAAALASDARYIHLGLVYGQFPFTTATALPAVAAEPLMHELDPALARNVASIAVAAPVAQYAIAWRAVALPARFVCVHWRQGDFATTRHCSVGDKSCVQPATVAAAQIWRLLREQGVSTFFLATDADEGARAALASLVVSAGETDGAEGSSTPQLVSFDAARCPGCGAPISALLAEQEVCGMADVCLLNKWSTFSLVLYFRRLHSVRGALPSVWWANEP